MHLWLALALTSSLLLGCSPGELRESTDGSAVSPTTDALPKLTSPDSTTSWPDGSGGSTDADARVVDGNLNADDMGAPSVDMGHGVTPPPPIAAGDIMTIDLSSYAHGTRVTASILQQLFGSSGGDAMAAILAEGLLTIVDDPFGSGAKVLRIEFPFSRGGHVFVMTKTLSGSYKELFSMMEIALSPNWVSPFSVHLPFFRSLGWRATNDLGVPDADNIWAHFHQLGGNNDWLEYIWNSVTSGNPHHDSSAEASVNAYLYHQGRFQENLWGNLDDATQCAAGKLPHANPAAFKRGAYVRNEIRIKLNTKGNKDGAAEQWVDGVNSVQRTAVQYFGPAATSENQVISRYQMNFWIGGPHDKIEFNMPPAGESSDGKPFYMYIRRWVVSTQPISH